MGMISSKSNQSLKDLRKLQEKRHRQDLGLFCAEGEDMLKAAIGCSRWPESVYIEAEPPRQVEELVSELPEFVEIEHVERSALDSASSLGSGSRVIGVWRQELTQADDLNNAEVIVYLHDVRDPANVGAVMRSTNALADGAVALGGSCADPFSPKAVRASMGTVFVQPFIGIGFNELLKLLGEKFKAIALVPDGGEPLYELDLSGPSVLCLGSERKGLPEQIAELCKIKGSIPMQEDAVESMNVAQAAGIALYQCLLHRIGD